MYTYKYISHSSHLCFIVAVARNYLWCKYLQHRNWKNAIKWISFSQCWQSHTHRHKHTHIYTPLIVFFLQKTYLSIYTYVCMYSHMYIDTYINAYTCVYALYIHIYICVYTYAYVYFYAQCYFLTCIQISRESGKVVWYSHLLKNFPVCCDPHCQRLWHSQQWMFFRNSLVFSVFQQMLATWEIGSKLGKEYVKTLYCHSAYLTYMWNTSCKILGWMKHKLESRLPGEISIISAMQMTAPLWQKTKKN